MQTTLILRHLRATPPVLATSPPLFQVIRADGKATEPRAVPAAAGYPVAGRPGDLVGELRWYLEDFLDYPFSPETEHAERVLAALDGWGRAAFAALFGDRDGGGMLGAAVQGGYASLRVQVRSDDPAVLSWPWEALVDPQVGPLGQVSQVERRLDAASDPPELDPRLPRRSVHILLVTARPHARDVGYRSISRPLVDLIARRRLPAEVHVLRPPTFERLREHLRERPHHYHILHFDGHGGYGPDDGAPGASGLGGGGAHLFSAPSGCLVFEDAGAGPDRVSAAQLAPLLREMAVPVAVLNACQSAMLDGAAQSAFASVGAALLQSGTRGVVAMAYSLYVSGAQEFLPDFYRRLFESGNVAEAVRAGRQAMVAQPKRVCSRGRFPLADWLVPVLYQHEDADLSFARDGGQAATAAEVREKERPCELGGEAGIYRFVGRDGAILALERALRRRPAAILIHGLAGVGKTTLARGFVEWLRDTEGLGEGCLWFSFQEIRSAEYVINRIGERLFGAAFGAAGRRERIAALGERLRQERWVLVWDNFEVVAGITGTAVAATLPAADRTDLRDLLHALSGGATKVLVTSRGEEGWLGEDRFRLALGGLEGEERWEYCGLVVDDLGLKVDRNDPEVARLMESLGGHPLMMRVMLRELEHRTARELIAALHHLEDPGSGGSAAEAKLYATLRFVAEGLPAELRPLLVPLAFHERFVVGDFLEATVRPVDGEGTRERIDRLVAGLAGAGLLRSHGEAVYEMHPALTGFLRAAVLARAPESERDAWARAFVGVMAHFADGLAPRPLHEQRGPFHVLAASFRVALDEADRLALADEQVALLQALGAFAQNTGRWSEATDLYGRMATKCREHRQEVWEAAAYHQLGRIAEEQRDFAGAEGWYRRSLEIKERLGSEPGAASTYHQLGRIAEEQRDFAGAEGWYRRSLEIKVRLGSEPGAAITYHQLGSIAEEQRDFAGAEGWYRRSLEIEERLGNEPGAAITYHQLGRIAEEQRDFAGAEGWYRRSLEIKVRLGSEPGAAITYHQLGSIAEEQRDFAGAEGWYRRSLEIEERFGSERGAASTYHQLGRIAEEQRDFAGAEGWYRRSLEIEERFGNEPGAAITYHQLGMIAEEQRDFAGAEGWYRRSLEIKERLGSEHSAAFTYGQLGILAAMQERFEDAARWLVRCIQGFRRTSDAAAEAGNTTNFRIFLREAPPLEREKMRRLWLEGGLPEVPWEESGMAATPSDAEPLPPT